MQGKKGKSLRFDENSSEPTDAEFLEKFSKHTKSSWFIFIFLLACLPTYCKDLLRICTTASEDIEITCLIPHLISKMKWNLTSIRNLTMPHKGRVCTYLDYNYSIFYNMEPEKAFETKDTLEVPKIKKCSIEITGWDYSFRNYTPTFFKSCIAFNFKNEAKRFRNGFEALSCILCGPLADLFGRKLMLIICFIIFSIGILISPRATSYYSLIAGYSIEAFGVAGLILLNYIIFVELCHNSYRGILMLYLTFLGSFAKLSGYILKAYMVDYTRTCYLFSIPTLSMFFYLYFVPESPRWYLSYGKKKKAWKLLELWGEDVSGHVFLPEIRITKWRIFKDNLTVLFYTKKYRRTIFIMTWVKFVKLMIIANMRRYVKIRNLNATAHKFLIFIAEIFSFFSVLPPFILFGRYITLFCMILSGALCLFIAILIQGAAGWYVMNVLSAQYFYALDYVVILYSAELLPTSARGTGLGFIVGVGELLALCGKFVMKTWFLTRIFDSLESYLILSLQIAGVCLMTILPNLRVEELPDWKRYRNAMGTY